jgi:hypothetical protein
MVDSTVLIHALRNVVVIVLALVAAAVVRWVGKVVGR